MVYSVKLFICVLCISLACVLPVFAQEKASDVKTGSVEVKKEEVKKTDPSKTSKVIPDKPDKAALKKQAEAKKKLAAEKEYIKGFMAQYKAGDQTRKVLAVNQIYKAYTEKKISDKTLVPFLIEAVGNPMLRVSFVSYNLIQKATGEKIEKDPKLWKKWWDEKLKKEEQAKNAKDVKKGGKPDDEAKGDKGKSDEPVDELAEKKKKALEQGKRKLIQDHNDTLGYLDRLILANGGEIECYVLFVQKDDNGKIEKYIVQFKDAVGKAEFGVSEVDEVEFDIDKEKGLFLPLPVLKEKTNP